VTAVFDTRDIPVADRTEVLNVAVAEHFVPARIEFSADGPAASGRMAVTELGDVTICSSTSTAVQMHRTSALTHDGFTPSVFMGLQLSGSAVITQRDNEVTLQPGDLVVYESTTPWIVADVDGIRQHKFRIPLHRLALPPDVVRKACAVRLSPGHPIADLAVAYFHRLAQRPGQFDQTGGHAVSQPSIELLRAVITTHLDATELANEALHTTLALRVMEYVRSHVRDAELSAGQIAAEHHISVRQLYRVLAAEGISLGDWVRALRLEGCRNELAASTCTDPIAAVARRWGFPDASSFTRSFRTTFGTTPRDWRELNRRPLG
jgi:AraC-like DNA-binding protein